MMEEHRQNDGQAPEDGENEEPDLPVKLRVILTGGGYAGVYHCGFLSAALKDKSLFEIHSVHGCSVGALIAPFVACDEVELATKLFFDNGRVFERKRVLFGLVPLPDWLIVNALLALFTSSVYSSIAIIGKGFSILKAKCSESKWLAAQRKCHVVAYNLERNAQVWFTGADLEVGIRCSANIPVILPPVIYKGEAYLDGSMMQELPLQLISNEVLASSSQQQQQSGQDGSDERGIVNLMLDLSADNEPPPKVPCDAVTFLWYIINRVITATCKQQEMTLERLLPPYSFVCFRPKAFFLRNIFDADKTRLRQLYDEGRKDGAEFAESERARARSARV